MAIFIPAISAAMAINLTLLDWADSGVGHPLLDQPAFLERAPDRNFPLSQRSGTRNLRRMAWIRPARAAPLLAPIAAARQAAIYRKFLDNIEPSEQVYHRNDPATGCGGRREFSEPRRAAPELRRRPGMS